LSDATLWSGGSAGGAPTGPVETLRPVTREMRERSILSPSRWDSRRPKVETSAIARNAF
jgi:hypothetical protein